jgi:hypothetical protein
VDDIVDKKTSKKLLVVLCSVIVMGLIAVAIYLGASKQDSAGIDDKLQEIYISTSHNYVNSLFGEPKISVKESDSLRSNFYLLDDAVLRTVTEDDSVVAFFITSKTEENKISVTSINSEEVIGEASFLATEFPNPEIKADFSGNGRYNYYAEIQGTGRYAMYNYYVFATLPYGFLDDEGAELCRQFSQEEPDAIESVESLRDKATPNTFGVIADGYEEKITMIPEVNNWADIYYLLTK